MNYEFVAISPSDPNGEKGGLGYHTRKAALKHVDDMNKLLETYPNKPWNTKFWKTKPEPWVVK